MDKRSILVIENKNEEEKYSISLLCKIVGIARSAYDKWINRKPSEREFENEEIIREMIVLHGKVEGIYGYLRMTLNMNRKFDKNLKSINGSSSLKRISHRTCRLAHPIPYVFA